MNMNSDEFDILINRIIEKCWYRRWYGPDMYYPDRFERYHRASGQKSIVRFSYDIDEEREQDPERSWFISPPVSEQELQEAEASIGCPLPPFFRLLYGKLANGEFGPGYGLFALADLIPEYNDSYRLIELGECPVDEAMSEVYGRTCWSIPEDARVKQLLALVHWGCGGVSYLDAGTGCVFYSPCEESVFCLHTFSFEEYMELWARDEMVFPCVVPQNGNIGRDMQ